MAGAVVVASLTAAPAAAAPTTLEVPSATVETAPLGINNRGQIVGTP